jgi:hypothetical protein
VPALCTAVPTAMIVCMSVSTVRYVSYVREFQECLGHIREDLPLNR